MITALVIGMGVMVLVGSALLAFAFAPGAEPEPIEVVQAVEQHATGRASLVFSHGEPLPARRPALSVEALFSDIEAHLRKEREFAAAFAQDPSAEALRAN